MGQKLKRHRWISVWRYLLEPQRYREIGKWTNACVLCTHMLWTYEYSIHCCTPVLSAHFLPCCVWYYITSHWWTYRYIPSLIVSTHFKSLHSLFWKSKLALVKISGLRTFNTESLLCRRWKVWQVVMWFFLPCPLFNRAWFSKEHFSW